MCSFNFFKLNFRFFVPSRINLRYHNHIKRLVNSFRHGIRSVVILVTFFFYNNNDDTEYSTLLDNRELMQVECYLKHNNNKIINIQTSHEITNYIQHN